MNVQTITIDPVDRLLNTGLKNLWYAVCPSGFVKTEPVSLRRFGRDHFHGAWACKRSRPPDERDALAPEVLEDMADLVAHHLPLPVHELLDRQVPVHGEADAVEVAVAELVQEDGGFPQGFGGEGARVDHGAPDEGGLFHDRHPVAKGGGFDGRLLPAGSASQDDQVEKRHRAP